MPRQIFSNRLTTILTMIGVSVGLGNVWRFPYMMGKFGGSAFLLAYLFLTLLFAIPAVTAEWAVGRMTRAGPLGAFTQAFGRRWGLVVGWLLTATVLIADSYYVVVIAYVAFTGYFSAVYGFTATSYRAFEAGLNDGWVQYGLAIAILLASILVIHRGLRKGIEAVSKIFVPLFGAIIIYLVISAWTLEGARAKFLQFLQPDFAAFEVAHLFAALGQAFFSLGLGGTFLIIYGSYLKDDEPLPRSAILTACGDVGAALLASLFIVPTVLVFSLDMQAGPGLLFSTLPRLFEAMPGGRMLGSLFMLALFMVAFLSNIAALEVAVGSMNDHWRGERNRKRILLSVAALEFVLIVPSALKPELITFLDLFFGSGMQVFGSALAVIALAWCLGKSKALTQILPGAGGSTGSFFYYWLKWVIPSALLLILGSYIYANL